MYEDNSAELITIVDDDGTEFELEVVGRMDYNHKSYALFLPSNIDEMDEDDPDYGYILLREEEDANGDSVFETIDDDDELEDVYERFMVLLFDDEDEEDDQ